MKRFGMGAWATGGALLLGAALLAAPVFTADQASQALAQETVGRATSWAPGSNQVFAKFDGVDGESTDDNHDKWIDVLSIDWGVARTRGRTRQTRRRAAPVVDDLTIVLEYEKASPKLQEAVLQGRVIPMLEIEQTANYGGARATYLKYELKNVVITSYRFQSGDGLGARPRVVVGTNFEEIKVTYTEYDSEGSSKGNVETEWSLGKGK